MANRREFLKTVSVTGIAGLIAPIHVLASRYQDSSGFFGVHPFIEAHPDAVFIMRTNVDVKTNSEAKVQTGLDFGRSVLIPKAERDGGIPLTYKVAIKPNLTTRGSTQSRGYTTEGTLGIITDANFIEGVIGAVKELGVSSGQIYICETNTNAGEMVEGGYTQMVARTGVSLKVDSQKVGVISENELVWVETPPRCVWFKKIPYLWPFNAPETLFLSIAKFKAHGMGLTLAAKNIQGTLCHNYQELCSAYHTDGSGNMDIDPEHYHQDAHAIILANFERHLADGIPRWDRPGTGWNSGLGMERWATRTVDNQMSSQVGLHIIEGIYGRDGNGFLNGPHPDGKRNDLGMDFMTNIVMFGKNPFHVDSVGHWLGGHEPGNMGYLHIALERGMSTLLDPSRIPVYEWFPDGSAVLTPLDRFERTPLLTYYLVRDYNGQTESYWHMIDEPFDYGAVTAVDHKSWEQPKAFVLKQNVPNPFNPSTSIEFFIPSDGYTRLEVFNAGGQLVEILSYGYFRAGSHMAVWNTTNHSSGVYYYRLRFGGFSETKRMALVK